MNTKPVFFDSSNRRGKVVRWGSMAGGVLLAAVTVVFVLSLLAAPLLPGLPGLSAGVGRAKFDAPALPALPKRKVAVSQFLLGRSRRALKKEIAREQARKRIVDHLPPASGSRIVAAFYAPWQETGLHSLRANAASLTHVIPEWLHLNRAGDGIDSADWDPRITPHNLDVVRIARQNGVAIHPILNNAEEGFFDPARVARLFSSIDGERRLAGQLRDWLRREHFQGVNLDFENLNAPEYRKLPAFLDLLSDTLHAAGLELSADLEVSSTPARFKAISAACDFIVLMDYDEHYEEGKPGPISSIGWYDDQLERALASVPSGKLVVGIGNYAYDWVDGVDSAEALTYQEALLRAEDNHPGESPERIVDFDPAALNTTFEYTDESNRRHEVWALDAVSAYNQWLLARRRDVRGAAVWVLGSEDPALWKVIHRGADTLDSPKSLESVLFPYDVDFEGEGEILSVVATPTRGSREISLDSTSRLCEDMVYHRFPSSYVIRRTGYHPKEVALTFDDGPDPEYTGQVLDALRDLRVPATFFVIGENAESAPDLVRRMWREGHEIGSHTFTHPNMGAVGRRRAALELNTTQRAIESILGRSTILFRPPYNADAEPVSGEEVTPVATASAMGYLTVGELIDPQDWNLWSATPDGGRRRRTADDLLASMMHDIHTMRGNVILLHDAGGDRSATVAALRRLVPELRREGYRFVTISDLLGVPRQKVMPALAQKDLAVVGFDRVVFEGAFALKTILAMAFIIAIILGIARVLFITSLAIIARSRGRESEEPDDASHRPSVSVLIAAYNEAPVIARTIASVLRNGYERMEVIVVDDGSTDATAETVEQGHGDDPRVHLIRQANGGKASALNAAIARATGEILVCIDADTQFSDDAISLLVRHFRDERVGAVAGNVKVGNRINLFTRWQSIEYITSQNLDRQAYALLNAITVVPGAIGAWRRSAVIEAGGYMTDTLAEDMDLTWRIRKGGWVIRSERRATAYTEAPDTMPTFFRQRFRWAYGTLQCLWKHRDALLGYGWFGWLALPTLWLFQIVFQVLAPVVDLQLGITLVGFAGAWISRGALTHDWQPLPEATEMLMHTGFFYALFFVVELAGALLAFRFDRERLRPLWLLFWQRLVYRQLMYAVVWKSIWRALGGMRQKWGKLQRKGTVRVAESDARAPEPAMARERMAMAEAD